MASTAYSYLPTTQKRWRRRSYILGTPDLAARMGQAGLALGLSHAEEHTFRAYEALYRQMLSPAELPIPA